MVDSDRKEAADEAEHHDNDAECRAQSKERRGRGRKAPAPELLKMCGGNQRAPDSEYERKKQKEDSDCPNRQYGQCRRIDREAPCARYESGSCKVEQDGWHGGKEQGDKGCR
jgi:hypothetical protein